MTDESTGASASPTARWPPSPPGPASVQRAGLGEPGVPEWSDTDLAWLAYALLTRQAVAIDVLLRVRARETASRAGARLVAPDEMRY
jgi:hypothetical protein